MTEPCVHKLRRLILIKLSFKKFWIYSNAQNFKNIVIYYIVESEILRNTQ
jgi:hypothetical protein